MKRILLDPTQRFFKANLHCHSTNSDGALSVAQLKEAYKKRGYSIVAFTDHEHLIDNSAFDDENFLTLTSCEIAIKENPRISSLKNKRMRVCHLNLYAKEQHNTVTPCYSSLYNHYINPNVEHLIRHNGEFDRIYSAEGINDIIKRAGEAGFLVAYNHPNWSLENAVQYLQYDGLFAVEVYNHHSVKDGIYEYNINVLDDFLRAEKRIFCTACDDSHNLTALDAPENDSFGGWIQLNAPVLTYEAVISALEQGNFYASQGPEIFSLEIEGNQVALQCSPAAQISLSTMGRRSQAYFAKGDAPLTEAVFPLDPDDGYFRLTVTDPFGRNANTQAYFLEEA